MVVDMIDESHIRGIGSIEDIDMTDKKQCVLLDTKYLYMIIKVFNDMKSKEIYVTVEKDKPVLIGGKKYGIILAPKI